MLALAGQAAVRADDAKPKGDKPDDKPVTLAMSAKVGDTVRYKSHIEIGNGAEVTVERSRKHTIKEIKDSGDVVTLILDEGGKVNLNGSDMDIPAGAPVTVTQDKANKILAYKSDKEENPYFDTSTLHLLVIVDNIVFPDKPVKPGDTWKTEIDNPAVKGKKVTLKTTFVGSDKAGGVAAWKIKQTLEAATDDNGNTMTAEMTAMLDAANGQMIEAEQSLKSVPARMGPVDWKAKIQRLKPEAGKEEKKPPVI
jgi:hypothetical protein